MDLDNAQPRFTPQVKCFSNLTVDGDICNNTYNRSTKDNFLTEEINIVASKVITDGLSNLQQLIQ